MKQSSTKDVSCLSSSPCRLCPHECGVLRAEGERGVCGAPDEMLIARAALHFWEEPPLSGESGSGTVFFAYCPLRCVYCQNATIAAGHAGISTSVERLAEICLELEAQGALNVNFVTPTHYADKIREAVQIARERRLTLPIVWNTSGYERPEVVHELADTVDVYLADYKYADEDLVRRYSKAPGYPQVALSAIDAMLQVTGTPEFDEVHGCVRMVRGVVVRHLVLPGSVEHSKRAIRLLYERYGDNVLYSIMNQYTPVMSVEALAQYPELSQRVSDGEYEQVLDFADALGMEDYYWQEGPAAEESFIPAWDGTGV